MSADYLQLEGKKYLLQEIPGSIDMELEIKAFHEARVKQVIEAVGDKIVPELESEWNTQLEHLRGKQASHSVAVPPPLFDQLTYNDGKNVYPIRMVRYLPFQVTGTYHSYCNLSGWIGMDVIHRVKDWITENNVRESINLIVDIEPPIEITQMFGFYMTANNIRVWGGGTFHTYSDGRLCTGQVPAKRFWEAAEFEQNVNRINLYSLASKVVRGMDFNTVAALQDYINPLTIREIRVNEGGLWSTND